jgi:hypothetical protein
VTVVTSSVVAVTRAVWPISFVSDNLLRRISSSDALSCAIL